MLEVAAGVVLAVEDNGWQGVREPVLSRASSGGVAASTLELDAELDRSAFNGPFEPGRTGFE